MLLKDYLQKLSNESKGAASSFADRCGTTLGQMKHVAHERRRAGESLAINIERESGGIVRCEQLRPDVDWSYIRGTLEDNKAA